jgi:hypothetical protein
VFCEMPPKKAAPAIKPIPTKESFFMSKRTMMDSKKEVENPIPVVGRQTDNRPRRFLIDKGTDVAYAEVVDDTAISLETGLVLFRFGDAREEFQETVGFKRKLDFSPPIGKRHPNDKFVDVLNLVKAGIIREEDVAKQKAFSDEELVHAMERLEQYHREMELLCGD